MAVDGVGLFETDLARTLRREFEAAIASGASAYVAGDRAMQAHADLVNDPEWGPVIFYALAALQMEHGVIGSAIRKRALTYINSGEGLDVWRGREEEIVAARKKIEQQLRAKLIAMG
ncbi:MAG TPA: hypothetical protein VKX17_20705 [Planctomycetota bacterium]|nr:hypothetical protein [Planctomycetota bacterium]